MVNKFNFLYELIVNEIEYTVFEHNGELTYGVVCDKEDFEKREKIIEIFNRIS